VATNGPLLSVEALDVAYGDTQVLWGASLQVNAGEIVALVGSNGAGKTTLLSTISGLLDPRAGDIIFDGENINDRHADEIVSRRLIHVPEGRRLFSSLSVRENLLLGAFRRRDAEQVAKDLERIYELFPILRERQSQLAGKMSGGEQQMCAIGRGLMGAPRLLMIDELSLGLAPVVVQRIAEVLQEINAAGMTILLVEQDVETALSIAARGYVIEAGEVTLEGAAEELLHNPEVRRAYLGV
jgi:branched-chain amino acid transport system ATP-binding protein